MRVEEPLEFSDDTDLEIDPVYRVDFWELGEGGAL